MISTEESISHSDNRHPPTTFVNITDTSEAPSVLSPDVIPDYALYFYSNIEMHRSVQQFC